MSNAEITSSIGVHRNRVATFVAKYIVLGIDYALNDSARFGSRTISVTMKSLNNQYRLHEAKRYRGCRGIVDKHTATSKRT